MNKKFTEGKTNSHHIYHVPLLKSNPRIKFCICILGMQIWNWLFFTGDIIIDRKFCYKYNKIYMRSLWEKLKILMNDIKEEINK